MVRIANKPPWHISESRVTGESMFLDHRAHRGELSRRRLLGATAAALAAGLPLGIPRRALAAGYPAPRNEAYTFTRPLTPEATASMYNNFYEFGSSKYIQSKAEALTISPWTVQFDGLIETPFQLDIDQILKRVTLEERVYRLRCVETWSMVVPWTGFPMRDLLRIAKPLSSATYVRMETFHAPSVARGQKQVWYPWPYTEGLTIAEADNDLAFVATGVYGKPLPHQFGAPIRIVLPWKYGFKSIKSIVRITLTDVRPTSFWEKIMPREYGFWANVNPEVPHPRWSQASEQLLGTNDRTPTALFNGYADQVASLYQDLQSEPLYR